MLSPEHPSLEGGLHVLLYNEVENLGKNAEGHRHSETLARRLKFSFLVCQAWPQPPEVCFSGQEAAAMRWTGPQCLHAYVFLHSEGLGSSSFSALSGIPAKPCLQFTASASKPVQFQAAYLLWLHLPLQLCHGPHPPHP